MTREMKESGIEWIGEIPKEWEIVPGKTLFKQRNARGNKKELQLLSPTQKFGVIPQSRYEETTGQSAVKLNEKIDLNFLKTIHNGDFCISLRSFQGGFEYSRYEGVVSPAYQVFYSYQSVDNDYYKYLFKTQRFIDEMNSFTMSLRDGKNIAFADFGKSFIPYPPLSEQTRIADYLDYKCSQIDSLVSNIEAQIVKLDEYKKALITQTVTKGLDPNVELKDSGVEWIGEIPKRWEIYNPKYLFKQQVARAKLGQKQLTASQKYGVISQKEFMNRENQSIVPVEKDFSILKQVVPGDFVISMRSFQGGLEYSDMEGSISSAYVMVHKTNDQVENRYYKWLFKSSCYIDALQPTSNLIRDGQAMRFTNFQLVRIPLPPIDEQKDIAVYLDQKCHQIDSLKDSLIQQKKSLSDYKKTLIFDYVTGKKEVPTSWDKERSDE